ncbi:MAG: hypothetical protein S4CHLAM45_03900 [Chlamydiales bacterium]|nr:hypothetical protein [Chlamydiales bacterium]MCH9619244.1 hypothetical protein [Chlamydiales bacterium]MCH9622506.1 hypothetical protein [Chlamydiales bacterium]
MKWIFLLLFGPLLASPPEMKLRHVYLTWQHDPCRTITITVHGVDTPQELTVYYDTKPHHSKVDQYAYQKKMLGRHMRKLPDNRHIYHLELTDLEPETRYYFTVGVKSYAFGCESSFKTIGTTPPYRFVEGGDWENTEAASTLAKRAATLNPDAVLLGGDYPSAVFGASDYDKWDTWLDTYCRTMVRDEGDLIPFVMAIGNHEVLGGFGQPRKQAPFFYDYFCQGGTGKSYFSLPFGEAVQLFVLDSGHTEKHDGKQLDWLKEELDKNRSPIKIALYHVPLYPSIRFVEKGVAYKTICRLLSFSLIQRPQTRLYSYASLAGRTHWLPLFDAYGMTVAFEHHDQTLKRTKPLKEGKVDSSGTLYLGDGGWGSKLQYPPIQGCFNKHFATLKGKQHFFWLIEISDEEIAYQAISLSGKVIDRTIQNITLKK